MADKRAAIAQWHLGFEGTLLRVGLVFVQLQNLRVGLVSNLI